jgi:hypothetical protein
MPMQRHGGHSDAMYSRNPLAMDFPSKVPPTPLSDPTQENAIAAAMLRSLRIEVYERLQAVRDSLDILEAVTSNRMDLGRLRTACAKLEADIGKMTAGASAADEVARAKAALTEIESAFLALDQALPMQAFRDNPGLASCKPAALTRYATLLARNIDDPDRRDRLDFLVARLVAPPGPDGRRVARNRQEANLVLHAISGGRQCPADQRQAVIDALRVARGRVEATKDPSDLFKTGLYSEIYAYKLTLREAFLDPDVLYAAAEYAAAVANLLAEWRRDEAASLNAQVTAAQTEARDALRGPETQLVQQPVETHARFERSRQEKRAIAAPVRARLSIPTASIGVSWGAVALVAGVFFLIGGVYWMASRSSPQPATTLPNHEATSRAAWIVSGRVYGSEGHGTYFGVGDPDLWSAWSPEVRRANADKFKADLESEGIDSAAVQIGSTTIVLIVSGKVVTVQ